MKIELIYDTICPNVAETRKLIEEVLRELQLSVSFSEINKDDADSTEYYRKFSSPTILIDDKDISGQDTEGGNGCRIYRTSLGKLTGVPPKELLMRAITA